MSHHPFHFSFFTKSINSARKFYGELLGCREGRSTGSWIDFDFYGNQLSLHINDEIQEAKPCGFVDTIVVPIPHFGCILPWDEFHSLADKLLKAEIEFIIKPTIRFAGEPGEQATMFFKDNSGNSLEFKAFLHPENVFAKNDNKSK